MFRFRFRRWVILGALISLILGASPNAPRRAARGVEPAASPPTIRALAEVEMKRQLGDEAPDPIPLWPGRPPRFLADAPPESVEENARIRNVSTPTLSLFLPPAERRTGMAIVVCAGGGYGGLDWKTHVVYAARVFNARGVAIVGLKYRTRPPHPLDNAGIQSLTLLDAQRAMRLVRQRAAEWGLDPKQIGVAGYSAGANLAMNLAAHFDAGDVSAADPVERQGCRPDFAIGLATWHWREKTSPFVFTRRTPPVFLVHATNDGLEGGAPIELPRAIQADLEKLGVPVRMTTFDVGGHGVGNLIPQRVKNGFPPAAWPELFLDWFVAKNSSAILPARGGSVRRRRRRGTRRISSAVCV